MADGGDMARRVEAVARLFALDRNRDPDERTVTLRSEGLNQDPIEWGPAWHLYRLEASRFIAKVDAALAAGPTGGD